MKIYLIRHGMTAGNLEKRYVGVTEESVLPEELESIRRKSGPEVSAIYSSPRIRCIETAKALFPNREINPRKGLQECDFGEFEYHNYEELKGDKRYREWLDSGGRIGFPGGETLVSFQKRCVKSFLEIIGEAEEKGDTGIALVVHGGTIMAVLDYFSSPHKDYFHWQTANASGYKAKLLRKTGGERGYIIREIEPYE